MSLSECVELQFGAEEKLWPDFTSSFLGLSTLKMLKDRCTSTPRGAKLHRGTAVKIVEGFLQQGCHPLMGLGRNSRFCYTRLGWEAFEFISAQTKRIYRRRE